RAARQSRAPHDTARVRPPVRGPAPAGTRCCGRSADGVWQFCAPQRYERLARCTRLRHLPAHGRAGRLPDRAGLRDARAFIAARRMSAAVPMRLMTPLDEQSRIAQSVRELCFDAHRLRPRDALQMEHRTGEHLDAAPEHAAGSADSCLVLIETLRRTVLTHAD